MRRLFVVAAVLAFAGCAIDNQNAPGMTGPSELSLALGITATPDLIKTDGASAITVTALDALGAPIAGLSLRYRVLNGGGNLSDIAGATNGAGVAGFTFFPPGGETLATIEVTAIGTNAQNQQVRTVAVRVRN